MSIYHVLSTETIVEAELCQIVILFLKVRNYSWLLFHKKLTIILVKHCHVTIACLLHKNQFCKWIEQKFRILEA